MPDTLSDKLVKAADARRDGRLAEARTLLDEVIAGEPGHGPALNLIGLVALSQGATAEAIGFLTRAAEADPKTPPIWLNLAEAHRTAGDPGSEIAALDKVLAIDPYLMPALMLKAQALERAGRADESAKLYRTLLSIAPDPEALPTAFREALEHGRKFADAMSEAALAAMRPLLQGVESRFPGAEMHRARGYAEHLAGRRKVFVQQPTGGHFPYLPSLEFFPPGLFPWFEALEAATAAIQAELASLLAEQASEFRPYVAFAPELPVNQWAELNHSPRWSAWFLWRDGVRQDDNCARCPATAAAVEETPLLDIAGKGPSVMFSVLEPRTRIPPHTGSSNVRTTVHLPLFVPVDCGFRVGAETRQWVPGRAWAFDDTIEHEAWNDSGQPRTILILDVWNPLLSEAERAAVRAIS